MKFAAVLLLISACCSASDTPPLPKELQGIGIEQHLGAALPLDASFRNEQGQAVALGTYFGKRPVLLALVYYRCPMLCTQILSGIVSGLRPLSLAPGRDFDVVAISIDPEDTPQTASAKRDEYTRRYSRSASTNGWHFLTGTDDAIHAVTDAVGFHYRFDAKSNMFIHASGIMIASPEGRLARYFYGVEYEPKDLKLGLIEASGNKIGSLSDQILLFCYHYDPASGKYTTAVLRALRLAGILTVALMAAALISMWRRERMRKGAVSP
jgi:protein SCO1/2